VLPSSGLKNKLSKKPARSRRRTQLTTLRTSGKQNSALFSLVSGFCYSLALKMEAVSSSEMAIHFYQTIRRYISEDNTIRSKR
jgi:hypothetical protein